MRASKIYMMRRRSFALEVGESPKELSFISPRLVPRCRRNPNQVEIGKLWSRRARSHFRLVVGPALDWGVVLLARARPRSALPIGISRGEWAIQMHSSTLDHQPS